MVASDCIGVNKNLGQTIRGQLFKVSPSYFPKIPERAAAGEPATYSIMHAETATTIAKITETASPFAIRINPIPSTPAHANVRSRNGIPILSTNGGNEIDRSEYGRLMQWVAIVPTATFVGAAEQGLERLRGSTLQAH
jgi:hypothetical protein